MTETSTSELWNMLDEVLREISRRQNDLVAVVVHLNDTYLIEDRPERNLPGFARIIATVNRLRTHIEEVTRKNLLLVVHSGDFLSPSLLGRKDHGEAVVKLLNKVGVDYCVLGNHEFDDGAEVLATRLKEAKFKVLLANSSDPTGLIAQDGDRVRTRVIWPHDDRNPPARVALTGVVSADVHESFESPDPDPDPIVSAWHGTFDPDRKAKWRFTPPNEAVIEWLKTVKSLEREYNTNVPFRIVLTHATQNEDRQLRRQIPDMPRTYILGGHDHDIEWIEDDKDVYVMKNLANAETVRVMLLLAGGESVVNEVWRAYGHLQQRESRTLQYPQDLEAVLLPASDWDRKVLRDRIKHAKPDTGFADLYRALTQTHFVPEGLGIPDMIAYTLRYGDHEQAAPQDEADVTTALAAVAQADDKVPVLDFRRYTAKLEARDGHIRRRPTNFGLFVAECVRLEAKADVAIINSGTFRCDSELDAQLSVRDLRETFLYDNPNAVTVLDVDSKVVDALIEHGLQPAKGGTGAYPQIADKRGGRTGKVRKTCRRARKTNKVRLAIPSFLLTRRNNDGYDTVLQKAWNLPTIEKTHEAAEDASVHKFSIVASIKTQADKVNYSQPQVDTGDRARILIELLNDYATTFYAEMSHVDTDIWTKSFRRWLGTDQPPAQGELAIPPTVDEARKKIRAFLRELPAVEAYAREIENRKKGAPAKKGDSIWDEPLKAAKEELQTLQRTLVGHDLVFRYRHDFAKWFDMAARGIPGWFPNYPD
ncbi:metallophosphoesterase [Mycobacterium colombiense]|uniref:metallophosphoesterase n=1 Tax=Mycobacterium colombiense TaxID=339268 RepID=UPI0015C55402|nr:metallophosphoesterase [Mycobacterium colombiense]